jgi:serine protease AprX
MKKIFLLLLLFSCRIISVGQNTKWIIQFTDKNNSPFSINNPSAYLSQKAIDRRTRYHIAIDSTDLPVNPSYIQQVLAQGNVTYLNQSKWLNQILIDCPDTSVINSINTLPFVKTSAPVGQFGSVHHGVDRFKENVQPLVLTESLTQTEGTDSLSYGASSAQVDIHRGEFLHNKGYTGNGMTIALLDAGFFHYKELSAFDSARSNHQILGVKDFVDYDNSVDEDNAHGMYCLSTIAANVPGKMIGTAPHANFWLLRSENDATEYPIEEQNWVAAAEYADSAGADMISSSLGYFWFDDPLLNHSYADIYANTAIVSRGAAMAANKGMIVTNSAGNEGANAWHYIIFPADADSVCTVGAVDTSGFIASFSSYGYPGRVKPNIVSVGVNTTIWGTNDAPAHGSGTSFSNPNINGLIACLWEAFPAYNNMTILNAVYQSADRYNDPDDRYGFGIPDMEKAYLILKQKQNQELYGNEWLFVNPDPFDDTIHIKLIGQLNGIAQLSLLDVNGSIVQTIHLTTEQDEVYDTSFINLKNLSPGNYLIKYSDSITTRTISVTKTGVVANDWFTATPVPFQNQLTAHLQAPEDGKINLRIVDAVGKIIVTKELNVSKNNSYEVWFSTNSLSHGVYYLQYIGTRKKTIRVIK